MAAERDEARGQLVARLVGLARGPLGQERQAALDGQQKASTAGRRSWYLRAGEVGALGGKVFRGLFAAWRCGRVLARGLWTRGVVVRRLVMRQTHSGSRSPWFSPCNAV